jgi:hypothetical protein
VELDTQQPPTEDPGDDDDLGPAPGTSGHRRWPLSRTVTAVVVLGLVSMWVYVIYLAVGPGRQPPIDRLDDPAFARAAEERCAAALDEVGELPEATETTEPTQRAGVVEQANRIYDGMLDDLEGERRLVPDGDQRERVDAWLADWRVFLGDRQAYVENLRHDPGARMLVSEKDHTGRHITGWIDEFAKANRMPSCASATDA